MVADLDGVGVGVDVYLRELWRGVTARERICD